MTAPILTARDLVKHFDEVKAVEGVSFQIAQGEIYSLLGPNGAGKTTTISMLTGLLSPTRGDATIDGHSVVGDPNRVKEVIGVVPQEIALYPSITARENLNFWGKMYGLGGRRLEERVGAALAIAGLENRAGDKVDTFSGGMKRRLNIAVGLLHQPKIIFMDEPTVGIDPQSRRRILDTVKELNALGMAVLYTTHYMEEAQELSDRVGIIDHGELIALGTQQALTRQVGETDVLVLSLSEDQDPAPLAEALRNLPGVLQADVSDHSVSVIAQEAEEVIAGVVSKVNETGYRIRSLDIKEPNLEAVFLHLTGRALRD